MKKSVREITEETIAKGGVLALMYFDVHGKSGDEVKHKMVEFVGRLTNDPNTVYAVGEIQPPIEQEGVFSTHAEVKVLAKSYQSLLALAMHYGPLSIEILKPEEIRLSLEEAQGIAVDVATASYHFSSFILNKVLSEEEKKEFEKVSKLREEIGRRLIEKGGKNG